MFSTPSLVSGILIFHKKKYRPVMENFSHPLTKIIANPSLFPPPLFTSSNLSANRNLEARTAYNTTAAAAASTPTSRKDNARDDASSTALDVYRAIIITRDYVPRSFPRRHLSRERERRANVVLLSIFASSSCSHSRLIKAPGPCESVMTVTMSRLNIEYITGRQSELVRAAAVVGCPG